MARKRTHRTVALAFDAITVEGALIAPAMLSRIAQHQAGGQDESDYGVPKGLTLREEIARYFRIGQALFTDLTASQTASSAATVGFVEKLLHDVFGVADVHRVGTRTIGERQFAVTLEGLGGRVPVVVVPPSDELDHPSAHLPTDGRRRSAASAIQDWLNAGEAALWACARTVSCYASFAGTPASRARPISRRICAASSKARPSQISRHFGCSSIPAASASSVRRRLIAPSNVGAMQASARVSPRAIVCAMASRPRCSAWVAAFFPTQTTRRCVNACKPVCFRCLSSLASFFVWCTD
jgi:hypothetical protein